MPWKGSPTRAERRVCAGADGPRASVRSLPRRAGRALRGAAAALVPAVLAVTASGCAREEPPPGTLPDNRPPRLTSVRPEDGAVLPGFDGDVRLQFDEPISVSRAYGREVVGSPAYRYRVTAGRSDVRLRPEEGWRDGVVYSFRFPPEISDILDNRRQKEVRLVFSTGPPITATRVEGRLLDRVQGTPVSGGRVLFLPAAGDSIPYTAVSDREGGFGLQALPPGTYRALGFRDQNRNRTLDRRLEPHDSATFTLEDSVASASLELRIVEPDTTPPRLTSASAEDSLAIRLSFDDHLRPEQDLGEVTVAVRDSASGRAWPVDRLRRPRPEERASRGTGERAAPATPGAGRREAGTDTAAAGGAEPSLPTRDLLVRLGRPMEPGSTYVTTVREVENLRGLRGGGSARFRYTPPADTAGQAAADTTGLVPADPAGAAPADTAGPAPADTTARRSPPRAGR